MRAPRPLMIGAASLGDDGLERGGLRASFLDFFLAGFCALGFGRAFAELFFFDFFFDTDFRLGAIGAV